MKPSARYVPRYIDAAREVLRHVRIVIDRFHVTEQYRAAADTMHKQELKRLKRELPKADYQQLKGSLWAFRKNQADLSPDQQTVLARLLGYSIELAAAHLLREELTAIFEQAQSLTQAQVELRAWQARVRHSGLTCFDTFLNTLDYWWTEHQLISTPTPAVLWKASTIKSRSSSDGAMACSTSDICFNAFFWTWKAIDCLLNATARCAGRHGNSNDPQGAGWSRDRASGR